MRQKPGAKQSRGETVIKDIRRATRNQSPALALTCPADWCDPVQR